MMSNVNAATRLGALVICSVLVCPTLSADELSDAQRLLQQGMPDSVIMLADQYQPAKRSEDPAWTTWEQLRLNAMMSGKRDLALQKILAAGDEALLSPDATLYSAEQQLEKSPEAAQQLLSTLLASESQLGKPQWQRANQLLVQSLVNLGLIDDALKEAARLQQIKVPLLEKTQAQLLASALVMGGSDEAIRYATNLKPDSLERLAYQWKSGKSDDAVLKAALIKQMSVNEWRPDGAVARLPLWLAEQFHHDALSYQVGVWALSQPNPPAGIDGPAFLKQLKALGERAANRAQLLSGDDESWWQVQASQPAETRWQSTALLAVLLTDAQTPEMQQKAREAMLESLSATPLVQWRLLPALGIAPQTWLSAQPQDQRQQLALMLGDAGLPQEALAVWQGVPLSSAANINLTRVKITLAAGSPTEAAGLISRWVVAKDAAADDWLPGARLVAKWWLKQGSAEMVDDMWQHWRSQAPAALSDTGWLERARLGALCNAWRWVVLDSIKAQGSGNAAIRSEALQLARLALEKLGSPVDPEVIQKQITVPAGQTAAKKGKAKKS
ncbi:hypothetical protein [Leeia oryzae]|uniref:hypothetical protein n=1 Tax=Leeia oryzae TaxID=356662 RepID=UPI00037EFDBF|nr:hypothetical protein [Leeia oryzae]